MQAPPATCLRTDGPLRSRTRRPARRADAQFRNTGEARSHVRVMRSRRWKIFYAHSAAGPLQRPKGAPAS